MRRHVLSIAIAVLALGGIVATQQAKWSMAATVSPSTPSTGKALVVEIESSEAPVIHASGMASTYAGRDAPCFTSWSRGYKMSCLLPPGAMLSDVSIGGVCGGCSRCVAPSGSFVRATTTEVDTWSATAMKTIAATVPDHDSKFIATRFEARVDGAEAVKVGITVTPKGGGGPLLVEEQACTFDSATGTEGVCTFLLFDSAVGGKMTVDVTATATGWGRCTTPACTPKPITLVGLRVLI